MLSKEDYASLKKSIKGWHSKKLAKYGILWPPPRGWKKKLIREYEEGFALPVWSKSTIKSECENLAKEERRLTEKLYLRMNGQIPWADLCEKARIMEELEQIQDRQRDSGGSSPAQ